MISIRCDRGCPANFASLMRRGEHERKRRCLAWHVRCELLFRFVWLDEPLVKQLSRSMICQFVFAAKSGSFIVVSRLVIMSLDRASDLYHKITHQRAVLL